MMSCQRLIPALVSPNSLLWGVGNSPWLSKFDDFDFESTWEIFNCYVSMTTAFLFFQFSLWFIFLICHMKEKNLSNFFVWLVPYERHPYGVEDRFPSTDPSNYNGAFPNYSPFLPTFILCLHLGGACVTVVTHDVQWSYTGGG